MERIIPNGIYPLYASNILRALIEENAHHQFGIFQDVYKLEDMISYYNTDSFDANDITWFNSTLYFVTMSGARHTINFEWDLAGGWREDSAMVFGYKFVHDGKPTYEVLSAYISDCGTVLPNVYRIALLINRFCRDYDPTNFAVFHISKVVKYYDTCAEFLQDSGCCSSSDKTRWHVGTSKRSTASWLRKAMVYKPSSLTAALLAYAMLPYFRSYITLLGQLWKDKGYGKCLVMTSHFSHNYRAIATCLNGKPIAVMLTSVDCMEPQSDTEKRVAAFPPMYREVKSSGNGVLLLYQLDTTHPEYAHYYQVIDITYYDDTPLPPESEPKPYIQDDVINTKRLYYTLPPQ
jgi:hypothetical protein